MDLLNTVMQWIVAPVAAVVYMIYNKQKEHHTDIAVLKSQSELHQQNHEKEITQIREMTKAIFAKLDRIEEALRERK